MQQQEKITWDDVGLLMTDLRAIARNLLRREGNAQTLQHPTALILTALRRQARGQQRAMKRSPEAGAGTASEEGDGEDHEAACEGTAAQGDLLDDGIDWEEITWENRAIFLSYMSRAMRQALIDKARQQRTARRKNTTSLEDPDSAACANEVRVRDRALHESDPPHLVSLNQAMGTIETLRELSRGHVTLNRLKVITEQEPEIIEAAHQALESLEQHDEHLALLLSKQIFADLSLREIAAMAEMPLGTVRHHLRKAVAYVQEHTLRCLNENADR